MYWNFPNATQVVYFTNSLIVIKYFKYCIESIIKYTDLEDVEIIVSANGCTDNTEKYLNYLGSAIPNLLSIIYPEPLGFAKAINIGIKTATCDKIVLLNNKTNETNNTDEELNILQCIKCNKLFKNK